MEQTETGKLPASFWVVTVLGLLWNSFGAYLYTMANLGDPAVLAGASPAMKAYVAAMPVWAHAGWAVGIWGSFLGSVLMVLRSARAAQAFAVSGIGAVVSFAGQALAGVLEVVQPLIILIVIAMLWRYSRKSAEQGILR